MGSGTDIPLVGGSIYDEEGGKNTIGSGVYIPWLPGVNIPWVGGLTYHG